MIEILAEFAKFNTTNQRLADYARIVLKKSLFSDLKIINLCGLVICEEYSQNSTK